MLCITVELSNLRIGQNWPNPGLAKYSGTRDRVLKIETCRLLLLLSKGCHDKPNHDLNLMIFVAMVKHQPYFPLLQSAKFFARDFSKISSHSQCFQEPRSHKKGVTHQGPDTTVRWMAVEEVLARNLNEGRKPMNGKRVAKMCVVLGQYSRNHFHLSSVEQGLPINYYFSRIPKLAIEIFGFFFSRK